MLYLTILLFILFGCLGFLSSFPQIKAKSNFELLSVRSVGRANYQNTNSDYFTYVDSPEKFAKIKSDSHDFYIWHAPKPSIGEPWPRPQKIQQMKKLFILSEDAIFDLTRSKCELLFLGIERYKKRIFVEKQVTHISINEVPIKIPTCETNESNVKCNIQHINVAVTSCSDGEIPNENMNESYRLAVMKDIIKIESQQTWGALRALETLAQLIFVVVDLHQYWMVIREAEITDKPRYKHRGLMIDTGRHFIPYETLLKNLVAMEMNKLNIFHWHISDDQSFPFQSHSHPELYLNGAFHETMTYNYTVIKIVVEFARQRGIRVIPEIDTPGHSATWIKSHPELMSECGISFQYQRKCYGPLNPILKESYSLLKDLYLELINLFPDNYLHIGLDEVALSCWSMDSRIVQFMGVNKIKDVNELYVLFIKNLQEMINSKFPYKKIIVWEDAFEKATNMSRNTVVQIWKNKFTDLQVLEKSNFPLIYSATFYLDHLPYGASWVQFYQSGFGKHTLRMLIGGEACMWNEFQSKETVLQMIWPTMSAIAELFWIGKERLNLLEVASQFEEQRCRMLRTSIQVGVGSGPSECKFLPDHQLLNISLSVVVNESFMKQSITFLEIIKLSMVFMSGFIISQIVYVIRQKKRVYVAFLLLILLVVLVLSFGIFSQ